MVIYPVKKSVMVHVGADLQATTNKQTFKCFPPKIPKLFIAMALDFQHRKFAFLSLL